MQEKHKLGNLTLHQGRIEDVAGLGGDFDFIDASGVLHHLPDPVAGLKALGGALRPEGTIALMIYGRYARTGVYMMQEMFRLMGLEQDETGLAAVKDTLAALPKGHVLQDYMRRPKDVTYDAGLVDTFLHRQDRAYTVAECLAFADAAGLRFMHWWDNILYYPEGQIGMDKPLYKKIAALPEPSIWSCMELYNGTLGQHAFSVCRPERAESGYKISFDGGGFMNYIPVARCREETPQEGVPEGCMAVKRDDFPVYTLGPAATALFRQVDGKKSVRECGVAAGLKGAELERACRGVFQYLWRLSYIFLRIPA